MGVFAKKGDFDEPGGVGAGLHLDLDQRYCTTCRRALQPWQDICPDDGGAAVPLGDLPSSIPPPPAHLLADDEDEDDLGA